MYEKIEMVDSTSEMGIEDDICILKYCIRECLGVYSECYSGKELKKFKDGFLKIYIDFLVQNSPNLKDCPNDGDCPVKYNQESTPKYNNANIGASSILLIMFVIPSIILFIIM